MANLSFLEIDLISWNILVHEVPFLSVRGNNNFDEIVSPCPNVFQILKNVVSSFLVFLCAKWMIKMDNISDTHILRKLTWEYFKTKQNKKNQN